MDFMDLEMTERGAETWSQQQAVNEIIKQLLASAREFNYQRKPVEALKQVIKAMRIKGGDEAVFDTLFGARVRYRKKCQDDEIDVDQLAALFADCAIVEAQPLETSIVDAGGPSTLPECCGKSILSETGRAQLVLDASSDGSSFICLRCGGLVSKERKDDHDAHWCSQL